MSTKTLQDLKDQIQTSVGSVKLAWMDAPKTMGEVFPGSSSADLPNGGMVSLIVDPPEGQSHIQYSGPDWDEPTEMVPGNGHGEPSDLVAQMEPLEDWDQDNYLPAMLDGSGTISIGPLGAEIQGEVSWDFWYGNVTSALRLGSSIGYIVGDLLVYGRAAYGERYAQALAVAEALGYKVSTVQQWISVCGRVPKHERKEGVPWRTMRYLASKTPAEREMGVELSEQGLRVEEIREVLQDESSPTPVEHPPCPICGGETTQSRCKECNAGFSAVAWHFAKKPAVEDSHLLLLDAVETWLKADLEAESSSTETSAERLIRIAARDAVEHLLQDVQNGK